ncbi:MAG: hypothetical protein HETSPECPRED_005505 [Heterodermia speciosa]|uniref:Cytochrome P450 n=1 Tax=Heterodermia speciosa TaxID=116794 RepID=A0A8H3IDL4_9LECA|nr:MAG: hypothetical protein HETSPECPRED_005505 [Heterodermia speciosa]
MLTPVLLAILALALLQTLRCYTAFRRNLAAAKASGIPYVVLPIYPVATTWLVTQALWTPLLRRLPNSWTDWWLELSLEMAPWDLLYEPFAKYGSDTLLLVAPGKCELRTADAAVISQVTTRRSDFPKPLEVYGSLMLYGTNVVTTEGQIWKAHRKITNPPFSEKNNHLVWAEAIFQAQSMVDSWMRGGTRSRTITNIGDDSMRLALHVISRAGFGRRMQWPTTDEEGKENNSAGPVDLAVKSTEIDEAHTMSYADTLSSLLRYMVWILIVPRPILKRLPFKRAKIAYQAYVEWGMYLKEMYKAKQAELASSPQHDVALDLLGALVRGGGSTDEKPDSTAPETDQASTPQLSESDILGNAFIFIIAGHETTSNAIHFSIIYLALHPTAQLALQTDLDRLFPDHRPPSPTDYETHFPQLLNSMAGAILAEELRLIPPVISIPKCVRDQPQPLTVNGRKCTVPADTYISILTPAAHRNPNCWPAGPPSGQGDRINPAMNPDNDLEEFKPERWILPDNNNNNTSSTKPDDPSSPSLYRPRRGAYIPFSEGPRSCLGRRFAQVKVMAVLATIFHAHSVELALDDFADGEQSREMAEDERKAAWQKAKADAYRKVRRNMHSLFTLQLGGEDVKVRFVRRR